MPNKDPLEIEFPEVAAENLVRLAKDLLRVYSLLPKLGLVSTDREHMKSISRLVSMNETSPTNLSSEEATALVETFRQAVSILRFAPRSRCSLRLWFRLYTHALLREARIFSNTELYDESPDYTPFGFADIWKGKHHGGPVCIRAVWTRDPLLLREIERTFQRDISGDMNISHPNVLPIIEVSEMSFPFCVMSPWMPGGNIIQYTKTNPDADRLMLLAQVCQGLMHLHGLDILHGGITPNNILIAQDGQACLADFGITGAFRGFTHHDYKLETLRYMAPERLPPEGLPDDYLPTIDGPSKESDVYSLALTSFKVLSGASPYYGSDKTDMMNDIRRGNRPLRPTEGPGQGQPLRGRVWDMITTSWNGKPTYRCELSVMYHVFSTPSPPDALVEFPPVGRENLIRLAEELLYTFLVLPLDPHQRATLKAVQEYISNVVSRDGDSPTILSSAEVAVFTETRREATSILASSLRPPSFRLWFRLYTHTLLLGSQIFPDIELSDECPDYMPAGCTDIWKGSHHGEPVCIKAIRTQDTTRLKEIQGVYRRKTKGGTYISHPNILPVIEVSEAQFPFCIMSPWMPNGNITQYTRMNPYADRFKLIAQVCKGLTHLHGLSIFHGAISPSNILVTRNGQACLGDFGITGVSSALDHGRKSETLRYMAPEHLRQVWGTPAPGGPTREGDVYSLAMTSFQVLTGVVPYGVNDIVDGKRPPIPTDPSQKRWLNGRIWDVITTSWDSKPQWRCELPVVHYAFLTPNRRDAQDEFPPVNRENLLRLAGELLHMFLVFPLDPRKRAILREVQEYIYNVISKDGASPAVLSSTKVAAFIRTRREATSILSSSLRPPSFRLWLRLYTHALLLDLQIFSNLKLSDESFGYTRRGFMDIWKGNRLGEPVCIKTIRTQDPTRLAEIEKIFRRKTNGRKSISHPNLLPVIKVSKTQFPFCIMSPWMPGGNIVQYTQKNSDADRLTLLAQVCQGLMHLHRFDILHGNIHPNNILITQDDQACLADFGIVDAFRDHTHHSYQPGATRYMAPERLLNYLPPTNKLSTESDVYSLAMTSFEVITGVVPYAGSKESDMIKDISHGKRPPRPRDSNQNRWLQDPVWDAISTCWKNEPAYRYELSVVHEVFSAPSVQDAQSVKSGKSDSEIGLQRRTSFLPRITSIFQFLRDSEPEIEKLINDMDKRLESATLSDQERLTLLNKLCKTCSRHRVIPKSMRIPDCSKGAVEIGRGGFADVSQGTYKGRKVAIKVIRVYITSDLHVILSSFCREGVAWKHLQHPNVLPLLGVTVTERRFAMVSEWMEHGNIIEFVGKDKHANRTELLVDVANGLAYMHGLRIAHGDLKGANILINGDRRACLADFGLSTITGIATHTVTGVHRTSLISKDTLMSFTAGGTYRWMSPELLDPERFGVPESEGDRPTRQSDCYALGMVIYEVLCGHHPYLEIRSDIMVVNQIMEGVRPMKPEGAKRLGFSDELWKTVELCWSEGRNARPSVKEILSCLNNAKAFWHTRES